jgi:hypothetical protein
MVTIPTMKTVIGVGKVCAFPGCQTLLGYDDVFIGEICHIKGEKPMSSRYNQNMTDNERESSDNLLVLCPTHHTIIDKNSSKYPAEYLKNLKKIHEQKYQNNPYNVPDDILKIVNVSVNYDEYSFQRVHNLLKVYGTLEGNETKKLCSTYLEYAMKGLTVPSTTDDVKAGLTVIFKEICDLESKDTNLFEKLVLLFLEKIPNEIRPQYIEEIKPYIENMTKSDFNNNNLRRFYKYLDRPIDETLNYLIENVGNFTTDRFNGLLSEIKDQLKNAIQDQNRLLMDFELRVWKKLDKAEREKDGDDLYQNLKALVNEFINIPT